MSATAFAPTGLYDTSISDAPVKCLIDPPFKPKAKAEPQKLKDLNKKPLSAIQKEILYACIKVVVVLAAVAVTFRK